MVGSLFNANPQETLMSNEKLENARVLYSFIVLTGTSATTSRLVVKSDFKRSVKFWAVLETSCNTGGFHKDWLNFSPTPIPLYKRTLLLC